ncbi:MAG: hypothetical protein IID32_00040 [Planctomycetes bacterium]|nr:hypothetical protein [Planctomycetota bacterium]
MAKEKDLLTSGPAAAAFLAAGIGCAAVGLFTTLAQSVTVIKNMLNWWNPAGPLTGKTGLAMIVWLVAWVILHRVWKFREVAFNRIFVITLILVGLGLLGTFPTFFESFGH